VREPGRDYGGGRHPRPNNEGYDSRALQIVSRWLLLARPCRLQLSCVGDKLFGDRRRVTITGLTLFAFPAPCCYSSQFDPAPRDENWHKNPRTPDYFL
jgi:hypothetical protein